MDILKLMDTFAPVLGEEAAEVVRRGLRDLAANTSGWKKGVLDLLASSVEQHGPEGVKRALDTLHRLMEGKEAPDLTGLDIATAGQLTAALHDMEDAERSNLRDFLTKVSEVCGIILSALIRGAL